MRASRSSPRTSRHCASQVDTCKHTITRMVAAAGQARAEGGGAQPVDQFLHETLERWRLVRPAVSLTERLTGPAPAPSILTEQTLRQAIVNLLNNAADASPGSVELDCNWDRDRAAARDPRPRAGSEPRSREPGRTRFFSTKPVGEGNGIGLLLARATLERLGGPVAACRHAAAAVCPRYSSCLCALSRQELPATRSRARRHERRTLPASGGRRPHVLRGDAARADSPRLSRHAGPRRERSAGVGPRTSRRRML